MANLIFIFSLLALWHFIYDGIILPTVRLNLRYKLFALRDRIRSLKTQKQDKIDAQVFNYLNNSINVSIRYMGSFNIPLGLKANKELAKNTDLQKIVAHNVKLVLDCKEKEVRNIYGKTIKYGSLALIANSGTWLLYLSPIIITLVAMLLLIGLIIKGIISPIKKHWRNTIEAISFTPEHEFQKVFEGYVTTPHTETAHTSAC